MTDIPAAIRIRGPKLLLRPLTPREIDDEWREMVRADPMSIVSLPSEAAFRDRLERSGRLEDGWLDLSPAGRSRSRTRLAAAVPPRARTSGSARCIRRRDRSHAVRVQAPTDPRNAAMRAVFDRVGRELVETYREFDRTWVMYAITRERWEARARAGRTTSRGSGADPPPPAP